MLSDRIRRFTRITQLELIIAAMPSYPIYREAENRYCIFIHNSRHVFSSETEARMSQLMARARWLRAHNSQSADL